MNVVNIRAAGRMAPYTWQAAESDRVYIGRPSKWGNPFKIGDRDPERPGEKMDRERVLDLYRSCLVRNDALMAALPELAGKTLGCWCRPEACHGDVLAVMVEALP